MQIIGLAGTNGSGKDTVGAILSERHNFIFISVTDLLRAEAQRRGLSVERENLRDISAEWRREGGFGVLIDKALELCEQSGAQVAGLAIASLRHPGEADRVHELGGTVVWVDADQRLRYDRIQSNAESRGRAGEDNKTFEQFVAEEEAEMYAPPGADASVIRGADVKAKADIFLINDGNDIEVFAGQVASTLGL